MTARLTAVAVLAGILSAPAFVSSRSPAVPPPQEEGRYREVNNVGNVNAQAAQGWRFVGLTYEERYLIERPNADRYEYQTISGADFEQVNVLGRDGWRVIGAPRSNADWWVLERLVGR